jgi:hypothetical protein
MLDESMLQTGGEHYDQRDAELANLRTLEFVVRNLAGSGLACATLAVSEVGRSR